MASHTDLILGEYRRLLDDRHRLSIPAELLKPWGEEKLACVLAKESPGCISLWRSHEWHESLDANVEVVRSKLQAGRLTDRLAQVQSIGRLLSTRHRPVRLAGRGRLAVPEGFREFLGVEASGEVMVVGAAVCIEIWRVEAWQDYLRGEIPRFSQILDDLSG